MNALFINQQWLAGDGDPVESLNPLTAEVVWSKRGASREQVQAAVAAARQAQPGWAACSITERIAVLEKFATLLQDHQQDLAHCISAETGKPDWEALTEVSAMINKVAISIRAQQQRAGHWHQETLALDHRAHGVMAVFGPYNFPGHLPNGHIVPALLAGNSVVFKPSEQTPWVAEKTLALWVQAGLPAGVLNLVQGGKEVGQALATAHIDGLLFTGSSAVGRQLHQSLAGRPEVLLALEMGGNNPLIVDSDVDLNTAANLIVQSAYLSAGQRCTCARRLIVVDSPQTTALLDKLLALLARVRVGAHDLQPEPFMGPVINVATATKLLQLEQQLQAQGAKVLASMQPDTDGSCLLKPGLIDVTDVAEVADDEWFGPLLQVIRVPTFEAAMTRANATRFGLSAGLISDDHRHQQWFLQHIKAGVVSLNKPTAGASSELPFGGVGASGNHRASAFYAADYCAWPQAQSLGLDTRTEQNFWTRGITE